MLEMVVAFRTLLSGKQIQVSLSGARCIGKLFMELLDTPSPGLRSLLSRDRCYLFRWQKIRCKFW